MYGLKEHIQMCIKMVFLPTLKDVINMVKVVEVEFVSKRPPPFRSETPPGFHDLDKLIINEILPSPNDHTQLTTNDHTHD